MKQIVFKSGKAVCVDVPPPAAQSRQVLVDVKASCISPGTEMMGLTGSGKSLWQKAKENPDKLKKALDRMKTEGVFSVLRKAQTQQGGESACGYSAAGIIKAIGAEVVGLEVGTRVAIAGAGFANHAGEAAVPLNLAMRIPDSVTFEDASTCALGGIALQGIRRADVALGDLVVVMGCGAIGLLTVQMLRAAGCRVIGIDLDAARLELASALGAEFIFNPSRDDVIRKVLHVTNGQGADRVILTVATSSPDPVRQAFEMSRRKGRVVLVGVTGMELPRDEMYKKELDFVISTSYGPGRYDEQYEQQGIDYPYAYVRWTEQRNMQAYLQMIANGSVKLDPIIHSIYPVEQGASAYQALQSEDRPLLVLLSYPTEEVGGGEDRADSENQTADGRPPSHSHMEMGRPASLRTGSTGTAWRAPQDGVLKVGLAGVGSFVQSMHIPNLKQLRDRYSVLSAYDLNGMAGRRAARLLPEAQVRIETDYDAFLKSGIDMVLIGTRHNSHAELAIRALEAGKAVFVEKPMCITRKEFERLQITLNRTEAPFMVGYNRRFAPAVQKIRQLTHRRVNPLMIHYTMNAGYIPYDAWVHTGEGGGRIIGEGCHVFDLFRSLTGFPVESVSVDGIRPQTAAVQAADNVVVTAKYKDGSICTLLYTALGNPAAPKERMEVFCDEALFVLTDYIRLESYGARCDWPPKRADKGHVAELSAYSDSVMNGIRFPIPWEEMEETWLISRQVADQLLT